MDDNQGDAYADAPVIKYAYNCLLVAIFLRALLDLNSDKPEEYCDAVMWLSDGEGEDWLDNIGGDCNLLRARLSGARQPALRMWEG